VKKSCIGGAALTLALSLSSAVSAVVVPNAFENTVGGGSFLGPLSTAQRTYQLLIDESQLTGLLGQQINSVTWRLLPAATADWPAADVNYADFDIYLGPSVDPSARSLTFALNYAGPQTQVRNGPLNVPAGSFDSGSSPNAFGLPFTFDTPYLYNGGDLLVELRHTGHGATSASNDAILTANPAYGTLVSAAWSTSSTATSGSQGNAIITQFGLVPEPASMLVGVVGIGLLSIRRRRA
jgi:hypothetical protein